MCKISLLILGSSHRGGFLHLTGLARLPWRPAKLRWLQCWVPNLFSLRLVWNPITWDVFLCWSSMSLSLFLCSSYILCGVKQKQSLLEVTQTKSLFSLFFSDILVTRLSFSSHLHVFLHISIHTPSSYAVNLIFHFPLRSKMCVCPLFPPSSVFSLTGSYAHILHIPVFLSAVVLLWIKSVKWKWGLSRFLSLTLSLPLFPDIKTRLCLQCFSQILECCQILKVEQREGERWRKRVRRMERRRGTAWKMEGNGIKNEYKKSRQSERDEDKVYGWSKSRHILAEPSTILLFLLSNYSWLLAQDQLIRWHTAPHAKCENSKREWIVTLCNLIGFRTIVFAIENISVGFVL